MIAYVSAEVDQIQFKSVACVLDAPFFVACDSDVGVNSLRLAVQCLKIQTGHVGNVNGWIYPLLGAGLYLKNVEKENPKYLHIGFLTCCHKIRACNYLKKFAIIQSNAIMTG